VYKKEENKVKETTGSKRSVFAKVVSHHLADGFHTHHSDLLMVDRLGSVLCGGSLKFLCTWKPTLPHMPGIC
jgi:hypothetical protein